MKYPITPPPELIEQWMQVHTTKYDLARQAAQWGADQELEACCEYYLRQDFRGLANELRAARRPVQSSLKNQALKALESLKQRTTDPSIIEPLRVALEHLDD